MLDVPNPQSKQADVRMRGFAHRVSVNAAWAWIDSHASPLPDESISLKQLAGRVLAEDVCAAVDVPGFDRAMMDGVALRAADTSGSGTYLRLPLTILGESLPGVGFSGVLQRGQAVRIMTGAPLPAGADAILPAEKCEFDGPQVCVLEEVTPGKHIARRGEDIAAGTQVLSQGRRLRPQDLGVLSSIGVSAARVVRAPRVRLVVTGNELLPPGSRPTGLQVSDSNGPMLEALAARDGGIPLSSGIVPDNPVAILDAMRDDCDVVLVSGGSSVGQEDHAPGILETYGELAIHGIAIRPSSPAGMGTLGGRLAFLLPGNPVSCLCAYDFFAGRAIRGLAGRDRQWPYAAVRLPLARKLVSAIGRVDYARVTISDAGVEPLAISGASILSSTTRADGFVVVPEDREGYQAGSEVTVWLYH